MKHFRLLQLEWLQQVVPELRKEVRGQQGAWLVNESRQKNIRVQRHTQTIFLRSADREGLPEEISNNDVQPAKDTKMSGRFPITMGVLRRLATELNGDLGRAVYTRLFPGYVVYPHIDQGAYYAQHDRYHLVVHSKSGSFLRCGEEELVMQEGELWWFDNKTMHDSRNDSKEWRTHVIFDLKRNAESLAALLPN